MYFKKVAGLKKICVTRHEKRIVILVQHAISY